MIPLVRVELTRLWWRRAVRLLLVLAVLLPAAVFALRVHDTRERDVEDLVAEWGPYVLDRVEACVARGDERDVCESRVAGQLGNRLTVAGERTEGGAIAAMALLVMLMLLVGTTFAGHDWNTGSMSNQLLFEPRRERVWLAKALAVGLLTGAAALAVMVAYWTGIYAVISGRDLEIAPGALEAAYKQAVLGGVIAAVAGTFGYALTMLLRSTVGTIGLLFAVAFACIVLVTAVLGLDGSAERFMPWGNFYAFAVGGYEFYDDDLCLVSPEPSCDSSQLVRRSDSVLYFALLWVAAAVPSLLGYRERDVP